METTTKVRRVKTPSQKTVPPTVIKEVRFKTLEDVLNDEKCKEFVRVRIQNIVDERYSALRAAPKGARLRRSPYDILEETNKFTATCLIAEFKLIEEKKSTLPSIIRDFIVGIMMIAIQRTLNFYKEFDNNVEV